jgi:tetratricopeptide (TPR) repeat protein
MKAIRHIILLLCILSIAIGHAIAQEENTAIRNGNKFYKQKQYDKALPEYQKAMQLNPKNPVPAFNTGNVLFRNEKYTEAQQGFENAISEASSDSFKANAFYNNGLALSKQKKLEESIEAWKNTLRLNPADNDARFNLEKALSELKKQNEQKEQKKQQKQQPKQQEKQKLPPSKLDKKKIEQYLQSLTQKEQEVQRKIQQNRARAVTQPDKDW